jgi:biotin carboxyl carrier protein
MGNAKVVSLGGQPSQVSHLCFETGGILGERRVELGAPVKAFDFAAFYALLGSIPTIPGHPARLLYDFLQIQAAAAPFTLASLRAEGSKATVNKAINARANAFYAKYANGPAIIARIVQDYSPSNGDSKPARLARLSDLANLQRDQLSEAYATDSRTGVVKTTTSELSSTLNSSGNTNTSSKSADWATTQVTFPPPPPGTAHTVSGSDPVIKEDSQESTSSSTGTASEQQTINNTDYGYRMPFIENAAQNERAQVSLIDEQFAQFLAGQNMPFLGAVFLNELNSIDGDVFQTQVAYLNTILMSPIAGTVTGIYKNPGEAVRAGETVIRVENNAEIFLVAMLIYRGPIAIGSTVTVTTTLFGVPGPMITTTGTAVAVRGQSEDDHWEVIVRCSNVDGAGNAIYPLGYHFDYDDTTVSIT